MRNLISIRNKSNDVLFEHEAENNTLKLTVELAVKNDINLAGVNLFRADLNGIDLKGVDLSNVNLCHSDLSSSNLQYANLSFANLSDSDLLYSNLRYAYLLGSNLYHANLQRADLVGANLSGTNLVCTDLRHTDLQYVDLSYANLNGTVFNDEFKTNTCKWPVRISKDNQIHIGCEKKSIQEWDDWFNGTEEYETRRGTYQFNLIYQNYLNVKNVLNQLK